MFFSLYKSTDNGVFDDFPKISDHFPRIFQNCSARVSLQAEALFLVFADERKETSAMDRKWLSFNRRPRSWTAVLQRMLLAVLADRNLSPLRLAHFFTLMLLSFIEPTLLNITRSFTQKISIVYKSYKVCFSFVLHYLDDGKIK